MGKGSGPLWDMAGGRVVRRATRVESKNGVNTGGMGWEWGCARHDLWVAAARQDVKGPL